MKDCEIREGGRYRARVSGLLTTVRVIAIRPVTKLKKGKRASCLEYDVVNLATGRNVTLPSARKFLSAIASTEEVKPTPVVVGTTKQRNDLLVEVRVADSGYLLESSSGNIKHCWDIARSFQGKARNWVATIKRVDGSVVVTFKG